MPIGGLAFSVARHKAMFFQENDSVGRRIDYEAAVSGGLRLVPSGAAQKVLADDYASMLASGMLPEGEEPFDALMERCATIGARANAHAPKGTAMTDLKSPSLEPPRSFLLDIDPETSVARITLNRPERLNALTFEVYDELRNTFRGLDTEPEVRAIVITGAGRAFCTGGDVEDIIGALFERDFEGLLEFTRMTCDLILAIRRCRQPVIAALNGTVAGAGAVIATACDVRIAAESARIAYLFTRVGLSGADMGAAWLLPRIVGMGRAAELLMSGAFIDAAEAHRIGLYNRVVPDGDAVVAATEFAEELARGPSFALQVTKDALDGEAHMGLAEALEAEARAQAVCMMNRNFREAYEAFVAKRRPSFD